MKFSDPLPLLAPLRPRLLWLLSLLSALSANSATITDHLERQNIVLIAPNEDAESFKIDQQFVITKASKACLIKVIQVSPNGAVASTSSCEHKDIIAKGEQLALLPSSERPYVETYSSDRSRPRSDRKFALNAGLTLSSYLAYDVEIDNSAYYSSAQLRYSCQRSLALGLHWTRFEEESWNHGVAGSFSRCGVSSVLVTGTLPNDDLLAANGNISVLSLAYSAIYRWSKWYFQGTIGFSTSSVSSTNALISKFSPVMNGSIGFGYALSEAMLLDLSSNSHTTSSTVVSESGYVIAAEASAFSYSSLSLKYIF